MLIQYQGNLFFLFYNYRFIFLFISSISTRSNTKFLSPATCPSSPWTSGPSNGFPTSLSSNELNQNGDLYSHSTSMLNTSFNFNNKLSSNDTDNDNQIQLIPDDLQSSTKDGKNDFCFSFFGNKNLFLLDLIKFVLALQQQHSTKIAQMGQIHSNALKRLEMQLMKQQNTIDRDSP